MKNIFKKISSITLLKVAYCLIMIIVFILLALATLAILATTEINPRNVSFSLVCVIGSLVITSLMKNFYKIINEMEKRDEAKTCLVK